VAAEAEAVAVAEAAAAAVDANVVLSNWIKTH